MQVPAPLYMLTSTERCWRCGETQSVIGLGTHCIYDDDDQVGEVGDTSELVLLTNIRSMPTDVLAHLARRHPSYMKRYSRMADDTYFANTCGHCSANFGDFYLFSEPGGAFFPTTEEEAAAIELLQLPLEGLFEFDCDFAYGIGDFILNHCQRNIATQ